MDLVLGLSLTSAAVRWVLVEGQTGEGAPIDRGSLDIGVSGTLDAEMLLDAVLNPDLIAGNHLHAVGVTWTTDATTVAAAVLEAFSARGQENVVPVTDADAATALASGIADITEYDDVAVCIVEPASALVCIVDGGLVTVERIDRPLDGDDALELTSCVLASLDPDHRRPSAVFVIGSDDVDVIVSSFEAVTDLPVISAAEADLALARGAALASAQAVGYRHHGGLAARLTSPTGIVTMVLGAAVVTFVVSLSLALGLQLTPDSPAEQPQNASAAGVAVPPSVAQAEPQRAAPPRAQTAPKVTPEVAKTIMAAVPPAPEYVPPAPAYVPPAPAYVPPAPEYTPPAPEYTPPAPEYTPPAYVPPAPAAVPPPVFTPAPVYVPPVPQQPRLRDRIIDRIPIINRFN